MLKSIAKIFSLAAVAGVMLWSVRALTEHSRSAPTSAKTEASYDDDGPMMLELYTPYCPSCSQMAPLVRNLAEDCANQGVSVVQFDISAEENEHLVDELDIRAVPTFLFIDQTGRETARLVGKQTAEALESRLSDIGGRACGGRT